MKTKQKLTIAFMSFIKEMFYKKRQNCRNKFVEVKGYRKPFLPQLLSDLGAC